MVRGTKKTRTDSDDTIMDKMSQAKRRKFEKGKTKQIQGESIATQRSPRAKLSVNKPKTGCLEESGNSSLSKNTEIPGTSGESGTKTHGKTRSRISKQTIDLNAPNCDGTLLNATGTKVNNVPVSHVNEIPFDVKATDKTVDSVPNFLENTNNSKAAEQLKGIGDGIVVFVDNVDNSIDQSMFPSDDEGPSDAEADDTTDSVKIKPLSDEEIQK